MESEETLPSSGERLSFIELFSEKNFKVEIPIIQRDYAQGRDSEHEVRASFLGALHEYLKQNIPHRDLDFVYGTVIKGADVSRFIPLDGQQRLTTLFLLHWYLAQVSGEADYLRSVLCKDGKTLFSYETRASSSEFCNALMANDIDMSELGASNEGEHCLSETIKDKGWFYLSWIYDPTVQSMLTMLDSIHSKFSGDAEYFSRLVDVDLPVITFLFLNLQEFELTDDLYIKMNARGKPLTGFENFKARLEQVVKSFDTEWPHYQLGFHDEPVNGYEYFIHKIDTDWANVFWAYRNEFTKDDTFDDELMNCIALIIANHHVLRKHKNYQLLLDSRKKLFGPGGKLNTLSFYEYDEMGCFSQSAVVYLIEIMDLIQNGEKQPHEIKPYLEDCHYYSEEEYFKRVISNNTTYPEKLRFYAFYAYVAKRKDNVGLQEWLRVVFNLTENTIINTAEEYNRALAAIHGLSEKGLAILELLKKDCDISGFSPAQILEEKVKAHLVTKSDEWKEKIVQIESHSFFKGQIGFILQFSGVVDYYCENSCCDWDEASDSQYIAAFNQYGRAASAVFSLIEDGSTEIDYLWERAVLSQGKYFTKASANRWNMLSTRLIKNNIERDHSWRRLLRLSVSGDTDWLRRQEYVKAVFDAEGFDINDVKGSLRDICSSALENEFELEDWRKALIKYRDLFKLCNQGFIVQNDNEFILLHESQRNHYHSELFSRVFDFELEEMGEKLLPFKRLPYVSAKARDLCTYATLGDWVYGDQEYALDIWFRSGRYRVHFY
ncbi:MAG: DUF262 domain-containing protein, partial [Gammaproteobacteria bacterium]